MDSCSECSNASRYCCPSCSAKTCSLGCCRLHKERTNCDGKRVKTEFVPMSRFTDAQLMEDLDYLQDIGRFVGLSRRDKLPMPSEMDEENTRNNVKKQKFVARFERLRRILLQRRTVLRVMPNFMLKHKRNRSIYVNKEDSVFWTVFWCFPQLDGEKGFLEEKAALLEHMVEEHQTWRECLLRVKRDLTERDDKQLKGLLSLFIDSSESDCTVLMKIVDSPANSPQYVQFAIDRSIKESLAGMTLIEFPEVIVENTLRMSQQYLLKSDQ